MKKDSEIKEIVEQIIRDYSKILKPLIDRGGAEGIIELAVNKGYLLALKNSLKNFN